MFIYTTRVVRTSQALERVQRTTDSPGTTRRPGRHRVARRTVRNPTGIALKYVYSIYCSTTVLTVALYTSILYAYAYIAYSTVLYCTVLYITVGIPGTVDYSTTCIITRECERVEKRLDY